ncbi:MAG: polysaccharide deacetylase family protein [Planctomycetes bacterium]|nr:polysaccharide deacetylase family protein [Planctomycetota bacterium]
MAEVLRNPSERRVAISFDDGEIGQFDHAFPILVSRGMSATFFVTTSWVGRPGYVSWDQLGEMARAGMSIQSHTHTHPFLSELGAPALESELRISKMKLDDHLAQNTDGLALPGGDPPRHAFRGLVRQVGYTLVATSRWGRGPEAPPNRGDPIEVRRCTVRGEPRDVDFRRIVTADRWLASRRRVRDGILGAIRSGLGPTRYSIWRTRFLNLL